MYEVTLLPEPQHTVDNLCDEWDRMDQVLDGLFLELARFPETYEVVPGTTELRCAEVRPFPEVPQVRCWFRLQPGEVCEIVKIVAVETG